MHPRTERLRAGIGGANDTHYRNVDSEVPRGWDYPRSRTGNCRMKISVQI